MDEFMDGAERQRAQTYYRQMQREAEERMCKFCEIQITEKAYSDNNVTMLQSTECYH